MKESIASKGVSHMASFRTFIIFSILFSIIFICQSCTENILTNDLELAINNITRKTVRETEKKFPNLKISGMGGSMKDDVIINEKLVFNHEEKLDEDRGRLLLKKVVNIYLKNIHSDNRMSEYLKKHPFTYKHLEIVFIIYDQEGNAVSHPDIGFISLVDGLVSYQTVQKSENGIFKVKTLKKEPYEDVVKRLGV